MTSILYYSIVIFTMDWEKIVRETSVKTDSKIILLVLDGLGGLPMEGETELEAAHTPNLDRLAAESVCGLADPVFMGIRGIQSVCGWQPTR